MTTKELLTLTLTLTELDRLARKLVGDGKAPNLFFVSVDSRVVTVTEDGQMAYNQWKRLAMQSRRLQPCLEDRVHGTVASVEPCEESDELGVFDDFASFFRNAPAGE